MAALSDELVAPMSIDPILVALSVTVDRHASGRGETGSVADTMDTARSVLTARAVAKSVCGIVMVISSAIVHSNSGLPDSGRRGGSHTPARPHYRPSVCAGATTSPQA